MSMMIRHAMCVCEENKPNGKKARVRRKIIRENYIMIERTIIHIVFLEVCSHQRKKKLLGISSTKTIEILSLLPMKICIISQWLCTLNKLLFL
jgi:hypothetical protein